MRPHLVLAKNFNGETALHLAAKKWDGLLVIIVLLQIHHNWLQSLPQNLQDANDLLRTKNERGNTALHELLLSDQGATAEYLIRQDPELSYIRNNKSQSALYLAVRSGNVDCVSLMLRLCSDEERVNQLFNNKSPIEAAIIYKSKGVLEAIFNTSPRLIKVKDGEGRNPLHFAASLGHLEEARYLLQRYAPNACKRDKNGMLPIHLASFEGHVDIIRLLLQDFPDPGELLDGDGCNILHVAAKSGRYNVFSFVLNNPHLNYLINMQDKSGNTPLHWASMYFNLKIVNTLTWNSKVETGTVNNNEQTALDVVEYYMPHNPQFRQRLTWAALKAASIPRNCSKKRASSRSKITGSYKDRVNTQLLVATLVATITFAAGFTMPGGYISSEAGTNSGTATMLRDKGFHVFIFCDTIAMYSSIVVATVLIWAQLDDLKFTLTALTLAVPLLGIALTMMSMAFTAGIFVVVSKLKWLSTTILAMDISFVAILVLLLLPLCAPLTSRSRILRYLSYYPFCWLVHLSTN
ncbi:hypothetical protein AAHA92_09744 [Salvia divinorum]